MSTLNVNIEDIERWIKLRDEINSVELEEITWLRNGEPIAVSQEQTADWRFVGMSNVSFAESMLAGDLPTEGCA